MKQQIVVSMTGFVHDPQQQIYKQLIVDLNMRFAGILCEQTSLLIVNDVTTEKYKIAKTYDPPITCVSIDWLLQCKKKNKTITNTENYKIKTLFYGAYIKVLDFDNEKSRKIENKLTENGAHVKILKNNSQLHESINKSQKISLLLTTRQNFVKLRPYMQQIAFPIVDLEWLEDSFRSKICKYPFDYAINQFYICQREPVQHLKKMRSKLQSYLNKKTIDKFEYNILADTIIYISDNVNIDLAKVLKKIIMVYGGFYLDILSPIVTHILTEPLLQQQYGQLKIYGTLVNLIRVQWLIDSVYLNKRMKEEDYFIRSFKSKIHSTLHLEERTNSHNNSSLSYNSNPSIPNFLSRQSISMPVQTTSKVKSVRTVKKYQSNIFKDYCFYIQSSQHKERELLDLHHKIIKNGGELFPSRVTIKPGFVFFLMIDHADAPRLIDKLKADTKAEANKINIQPISFRWVNECVSKSQFIDYLRADSYIYKPFAFSIPIKDFHKMIFDVLAVDDVKKARIKQLYNTLGSTKNTPNRVELTHCLCGDGYKQTARYRDIKSQNHRVKYVDWKWLLQCANAGKIVEIDSFLLENNAASSSQQTEYSVRSCKALKL